MISSIEQNIFSVGKSKLNYFPNAINAWENKIPFPPVALEIQPSELCSHACPNCQSKYSISANDLLNKKKHGQFLDLSLLKTVWDDPPSGIIISGHTGDPLMHPEISALLMRIKNAQIPVVVITNGSKLDENLAHLIVSTCRGVRISLDAFDHISYKQTHGVPRHYWEVTLANIRMLVNCKNKLGRKAEKCLIGIGYLTNESTANGMCKAAVLAKSIGVDYIHFRPFHYDTYSIEKELDTCQKIEEQGKFRVFSSAQKYRTINGFSRKYAYCHGSAFFSVIDARGDFYICCHHVGSNQGRIGSLSINSWEELLKSKVDFSRKNGFPNSQCIPHCRLHTHNITLELINKSDDKPTNIKLSDEMISHAAFL